MNRHEITDTSIKLFGLFTMLWVLIRLPGYLLSSVSWALQARQDQVISFAWRQSLIDLMGSIIQVIAGFVIIKYSTKLANWLVRENTL